MFLGLLLKIFHHITFSLKKKKLPFNWRLVIDIRLGYLMLFYFFIFSILLHSPKSQWKWTRLPLTLSRALGSLRIISPSSIHRLTTGQERTYSPIRVRFVAWDARCCSILHFGAQIYFKCIKQDNFYHSPLC